jgi:hypothetical protein
MRLDAHVVVAGAMFAIFASMTAAAASYGGSAGHMPFAVGLLGLALSGWQLRAEIAGARREPRVVGEREAREAGLATLPRDVRELPAALRDELMMTAWLVAFTTAIVAAGFLAGGTLAVAVFLRFRLGERLVVCAAGALLAFLLLHFVFERTLGLVLFEGLLFGG